MKNNVKLWVLTLFVSMCMTGCGREQSENAGENVEVRTYQMYYEQSPEAAYSADEWLASGQLQYPFDLQEDTSQMQTAEMFARFYVPQEALTQAKTEELVYLCAMWPMTIYSFYNYPSHYLEFLTDNFNAADNLTKREDLAEVVLDLYEKENFLQDITFANREEQMEYKQEAYVCERRIVLEEILLASNSSFEQMDEEMRERTLVAVLEKIKSRESGEVIGGYTTSGFLAYICEQHADGNSEWYNYIMTKFPDSELISDLERFEEGTWLQ